MSFIFIHGLICRAGYCCAILLLNYGKRGTIKFDLGTDGLILYAESREEIFADNILALALRPNRVKNRDLWDILFLTQQSVIFDYDLVTRKLEERAVSPSLFHGLLVNRIMDEIVTLSLPVYSKKNCLI